MAEKYEVASLDQFADNGARVIVDIEGIEVAVFRIDGEFHALGNFCVHQGGPLCEGGVSGRITTSDDGWEWYYEEDEKYVHCPWHGWIFDITTGKNVDADQYRVPTYDVEIDDETVYVVR